MSDPKCENCRFGIRVEYQAAPHEIECHRNAPLPIPQPVDDHWDLFNVVWPSMDLDDWCGEFKPKDSSR